MLTLDSLCNEMALSGRSLTTRSARNWWTKGLLPKPQRRSLGKAGSETYWLDRSVVEQAAAAHDLLGLRSRADATLVRLWLMGFPIAIDHLKPAWLELIEEDVHRVIREETDIPPEDAVGEYVSTIAKQLTRDRGEIFEHLSDLLCEGMNVFFGTGDEVEGYGLAAAAREAMAHLNPNLPNAKTFPRTDEEALDILNAVKDWCSLPAQKAIIAGATSYEFARARRLMLIGFGVLGRKRESIRAGTHQPLAVILGRAVIPVLIKLLRTSYAHEAVDTTLQLSRQMRRSSEFAALLAATNIGSFVISRG